MDGKIIDGFHLYVYLFFYFFTSMCYFYKIYFLNLLGDGMLNEIFLMRQTDTIEWMLSQIISEIKLTDHIIATMNAILVSCNRRAPYTLAE